MDTPPQISSPPPMGNVPPYAPAPAPAPPLAPPQIVPKGSDKIWSVLSHLSAILGVGFVLPLVVYLVMKGESEYVAANAKEALNFHISIFIYCLCCIPLVFVIIGIPLMILIGVAALILAIVAAVKSAEGGCYRYPLTLRLIQ